MIWQTAECIASQTFQKCDAKLCAVLNAVDEFCLCYFFLPKKLLCYKIRLKFYLPNCTTWPCNLCLSQNLSKQNIFLDVSYFPLFFLLSLLKNDILYLNIYVWNKKTFRWWGTRYGCILYLRMSAHSQCGAKEKISNSTAHIDALFILSIAPVWL